MIFFHGTPSTGGQGAVVAEAARSHGVRLIAPSRPGYGGSTMSPPGLARTANDTLELADKLRAAGLTVERVSCALFALFFPALLIRIVENFTKRGTAPVASRPQIGGWLNEWLIRWHRLETALIEYVSWPVGVTLMAVARKPTS